MNRSLIEVAEACAPAPGCGYIRRVKPSTASPAAAADDWDCEVCILAGGASSRMGRNKAALRLGGRTLLGHVRAAVKPLGLAVRVIRRDLIPGCGPLGGIHTALTTGRAAGGLFLSCDMPFVSTELLRQALRNFSADTPALFVQDKHGLGFPFLLRRDCLPLVEQQLATQRFSLQLLARSLRAKALRPTRDPVRELFNVNTPTDWQQARTLWRARIKHDLSLS